MRSILLIILASVITIACQQRAETNEASSLSTSLKTSDSLIIRNEEMISNDPFGLGDSILTYLSYNKDIDTLEVFENPVEDHEGDTTQVPLAGFIIKSTAMVTLSVFTNDQMEQNCLTLLTLSTPIFVC